MNILIRVFEHCIAFGMNRQGRPKKGYITIVKVFIFLLYSNCWSVCFPATKDGLDVLKL